MLKKTFSIFLVFLLILSPEFTAAAYEPNGFTVAANAGMLASLDTGEILYGKNIDERLYPASITKIMTTLLMLESEQFDPDGRVTMTEDIDSYVTGTGSSVSNLKVGEEFSQMDLVYLVLMSSYGDCAYLAAIFYGGSVENFVAMMNRKAEELGLENTHYSNPVGLHSEDNYTTVRDIRTLTVYALQNETFKTVSASARYQMPATNLSAERTISTTNLLQDPTANYYYAYAKGVKTGYTDEAGRCLVSTASYNGYSYLCILMGCPVGADVRYEFKDSAELYRWAFNNFEFKQAADTENPVCEVAVDLSLDTDHVPVYIKSGFITVLPSEADESTIVVKTHLNSERIDAPVEKGQVVGTADIIYAEQVLGTVELVAGESVDASVLLTVMRTVKTVFSSIYMKIVYALAAIAVLIFILMVIRLNTGRSKKRRVKYIPYDKGKDERP